MISFILTLKRLLSALRKLAKDSLFRTLIGTLAVILLSGTIFYYQTEGWALLDSLYFAFISLLPTSMETGLIPEATLSKWFTMIYLVVGMGVMLMILIRVGLAVVNFEVSEEKNNELQKLIKKQKTSKQKK
ncbi:potassium channel family protein [Neobacillus sp. MER 74]|uniref:ion channel n=1 Tax=Neobacillus sp. MER 74 TaxID=2939566 RepID=UPI00203AD69C|nr:ion channel [Neobacillus sp. MER 74]MCM3118734.1 potassium channel family protein [Neobacillus sp. MER 74]